MTARTQPHRQLLSAIRIHEIIPLQGSPAVGAVLAAGSIGASEIGSVAILMAASCCLVAHAFLINDWAGIDGDLNTATRAEQTFIAKGVGRDLVGVLAGVSLLAGLVLSGFLGATPLIMALGIAAASALYSLPPTHMKGTPVAGTVLHLAGGALQFLLGYTAFASLDSTGVALSAFFGLAFAAGHLMHEVRDYEGDLANGIRTNAVVFGKRRAFLAGLALFGSAYALLVTLASLGILPKLFVLGVAAFALHLAASLRTLREGMNAEGMHRLQRRYHLIFAAIGILLIVGKLMAW